MAVEDDISLEGTHGQGRGLRPSTMPGASDFITATELDGTKNVPSLAELMAAELREEVEKALAAYWSDRSFPGTIQEHLRKRYAAARARESRRFVKDWNDQVARKQWSPAEHERFRFALAAQSLLAFEGDLRSDGVRALYTISRALYFVGRLHGSGPGEPAGAQETEKQLSPSDAGRALGKLDKKSWAAKRQKALEWWEANRMRPSKKRPGKYISKREASMELAGEVGLSSRKIQEHLGKSGSPALKGKCTQ